jgi:hypothetical protein
MTDKYEANLERIDAAADMLDDGEALANEAIAIADNIISLTNSGQMAPACVAAERAAKFARDAALEYARAADLLRLEAYCQAGNSEFTSGRLLHERERAAREADKHPNSFCPHLG